MSAVNLDIDLHYLTQHYQALKKSGKIDAQTLEELMEDVEVQQLTKENIFKNTNDIVKIFKLEKPRNRYALLKMLPSDQLYKLLQDLEVKELILGLKFYHKEVLLKFVNELPKEKMIKMLGSVYSFKNMVSLMPEKTINKFIQNDKVEKKDILELVKGFSPAQMSKMITHATGKRPDTTNKTELFEQLQAMKPEFLKKGLTILDKKDKIAFTSKLLENNPKYMELFEEKDLMKVFAKSSKPEILESMEVLEVEDLSKMVATLPREMLTQVLSQIDPEVFAQELMKNNLDILNDLV